MKHNYKEKGMEKKDNPTAIGFDKEYYDWIAELRNRYR